MRLLALLLLMAAPLTALPASPAAAQKPSAATLLTGSSPARDASSPAPVSEVTLSFAARVELFSVTIAAPDGSEITVYQTDYQPGTPRLTGKDFALTLAEPLTQPGDYTISYLLKTKGIASLNGNIAFTIAPPGPAQADEAAAPEASGSAH